MKRFTTLLILVTLLPLLGCSSVQAAVREQVCLNGIWKFSPGSHDQDTLAADAKSYDIPVPSFWDYMHEFGIKADWPRELTRGWYRRQFNVSPAWKGKRITLKFDAVRYVAEVFVNGKSMGKHIDGFMPFTVDITNVVRHDKPNDLLVKVTNWKGLLYPDAKHVKFPPRVVIRYKYAFFAPAGLPPRVGNQAGIWQDVWLQAGPKRRIDQIKINTSVTKKTLGVRVWLAGKTGKLRIRHEVLDGDKVVLTANGKTGSGKMMIISWPDAKLWWPHDPKLYHLRTRLLNDAGKVVDEVTTRFGFREIRIKGRNQYLNGERLNLRADNWVQISDWCGQLAFRKEYAKKMFELMKRCNINAVRVHGSPGPPSTLDAADEVGMMILNESGTYGSEGHMRMADARFQKNNLRHLEQMIRRDWNHPSVIAYALSNEFGAPANHDRAVHQMSRRLDPTRIVYSDGNTSKNADVWCGHYTYHWARESQLPNTAYWFGDPADVKRRMGQTLESIKRPTWVGEFYNVDTTANSPASSVFFGPKTAKTPRHAKRNLHFETLRFVTEGARYTGLAQINPFCLIQHIMSFSHTKARIKWPDPTAPGIKPTRPGSMTVNPGYLPGQQYNWLKSYRDVQFAYCPMYAYTKQYAHTFWSGDTVKRRITCFNDDMRKLPKLARWSVTVGGKQIAAGKQQITSKIGFRQDFDIEFTLPEVTAKTTGVIKLAVDVDGKQVFANNLPLTIFPSFHKIATKAANVGLWRVSNTGKRSLKSLGVSGRTVSGIDDLKGLDVLILGRKVAGKGNAKGFYEAVAKFVGSGGTVIALAQDNFHWMPGRLEMDKDSWTTIAHPAGDHPITASLNTDDLRFWGDDHTVARKSIRLERLPKASKGIVVAGSAMGLIHAPVVEYRYGKGAYILCQMPALSKSPTEGAAGTLIRNMVSYGLTRKRTPAAPPKAFVYRRLWEMQLPNSDVIPSVEPNRHTLDPTSQIYGSDKPVVGWFRTNSFAEWKVKGIPKGIDKVDIRLHLRTGDGGHTKNQIFRYSVAVNGKPVKMQNKYEYERETFDSFQGWKIITGSTSSIRPVKIRNGDIIRITAHKAWAAIITVRLSGEFTSGQVPK